MKSQRLVAWFAVLVFALMGALTLAAAESYVVIKDKNGVCKVISSDHKTPKTIAGPFKTKEEAQKAKAEECAKAAIPGVEPVKEKAKEKVEGAKSSVETRKEKAKEKAEEKARKAEEKAQKAKEKAEEKAQKAKEKAKESIPSEKK